MGYWPNDGGHFNVMHLTGRSSMQVMGESSEADLSRPDLIRQHPQGQRFSYTGTGAGPVPVLAGNYRAPLFAGNSKKKQSDSKGYSRRRITTKKVHPLLNWDKNM